MAGLDDFAPPPPASRWRGARTALAVLLGSTVLGVPVAFVWMLVSPRVPGRVTAEGVILAIPETKAFIAGDAVFLIVGIVAGTVLGLLTWAYARAGGVRTVVALAVGGLLGSLVAEQVAERLTRRSFDSAVADAALGDAVDRFLRLGARGVLVGWPVAALIAFLVLTWRGTDADLDEELAEDDVADDALRYVEGRAVSSG